MSKRTRLWLGYGAAMFITGGVNVLMMWATSMTPGWFEGVGVLIIGFVLYRFSEFPA